uniref:E3 ubiquitin-protein ligase E3D n=1 Tax=Anopheles marajoara TaxID=58244 RepID=A0A2M4BLL2_9DIPT
MASSTGNIERVLIELRPRLQSANFFISFRRRFAETDSTTIDLANDRLTIGTKGEQEKYEIRVGDYFKLHTQTLSSLVIKNQYLCFRVNTNESDFGSELLGFPRDGSATTGEELPRLLCNIESGKRYRLLCNNCRGPMDDATEGILFNRVLELPSEQMDSEDWFCHRHDHQHQHGEPEGNEQLKHEHESGDYKSKLEPQRNDLLFGSFYALLHRSVLPRIHIRNNRFLYCKRCLQYLGTTRQNSSSVKLWYEHIRFQQIDSNEQLVRPLFNTSDSLELFRLLVRKTVREFNIVSSFGLPPMMKLMFELRRPGLEGDVFYLLLQIMDSQLSVFRINQKRGDEASGGSCSDDVDDHRRKQILTKENGERSQPNGNHIHRVVDKESDKNEHHDDDDDEDDDDVFIESRLQRHSIHLEQQRAMKLMYQYEKYEQQPLFNLWREDSNVVSLEISEPMFTAAIHYLDRNSSYVPECYRVNLGFTLSYLDIT